MEAAVQKPKARNLSVRLDPEVQARFDAFAEQERAVSGLDPSESQVLRKLVIAGLEVYEAKKSSKK